MIARITLIVAVVVLAPQLARAHDFWLVPKTHHVERPGLVPVELYVGQPERVTDFKPAPSQYARWEVHGAAGKTAVRPGAHGAPAIARLLADDVYTISYESRHNYVELEPGKFTSYLEIEGLEDVIAERASRGEATLPGQEGFARYAKALVRVGDATAGFDRKVGMAAEIVALADPFAGGRDGQLTFQLWYLGKPRADALMELFALDETTHAIVSHGKTRTDADGTFAFPTPGRGRWMVTGTVMRRASYPVEADWESFWASLSFQIESTDGAAASTATAATRSPTGGRGPLLVFGGVLGVLGLFGLYKLRRRLAPVCNPKAANRPADPVDNRRDLLGSRAGIECGE